MELEDAAGTTAVYRGPPPREDPTPAPGWRDERPVPDRPGAWPRTTGSRSGAQNRGVRHTIRAGECPFSGAHRTARMRSSSQVAPLCRCHHAGCGGGSQRCPGSRRCRLDTDREKGTRTTTTPAAYTDGQGIDTDLLTDDSDCRSACRRLSLTDAGNSERLIRQRRRHPVLCPVKQWLCDGRRWAPDEAHDVRPRDQDGEGDLP